MSFVVNAQIFTPLNPIDQAIQLMNATATIEGRVYQDDNGNGVQDAGENGIENVIVIIIDSNNSGTTTTTDINGDWSKSIIPGSTLIFIDNANLPPGSIQTEGDDPSTVNAIDNAVTDAGNDGYAIVGDLEGLVYFDVNGNGTQDVGENGIPDVDVQIDDAFGNTITSVTDANGEWSEEVLVGNVTSTVVESDPDFPTGATQTEGTNPTTTLVTGGDTFAEVDGFFESGEISGRLYLDINGNGTQDTGENGIADIDVQIDDALGNTQTLVTDANGDWSILAPVGTLTSTIDESDPDFPIGTAQTEGTNPTTTTITNGDVFTETDGYFQFGTLTGRLYFDTNGNGTQDTGENGIPNVDVEIENIFGTTQIVVTDTNGDWSIDVAIGNATSTIDETDPDFPTGATQTEGTNPTTTLVTAGDTFAEVDGYFESGELSGRLYLDINGNGTQDAGENGIADINVQIDDVLGDTQIVVTDANGDWSVQAPIGNVTSTIDESDPDFPIGTTQTEGTNPTTTTITNGDVFTETDGYFQFGTLTGRLYFDTNGNGTQDAGENGIPDVDVEVEDVFGTTQIIVTDTNGDWSVDVAIGNATSTIDETDPDFPTGATQTEGTNPTTTLVTAGDTFAEVDGFFQSGELSGRLYLDVNGNGTQDAGENGIPDVDVQIDDALGNTQIVVTDVNGDWTIQLPIGNVTSTIDESDPDFPIGATQTEGTNPTTTTITNGDVFNETDGYFQFGTLTGRLYFDTNGNGTQDAGENGIPDVDVEIENVFGTTQIVVTDTNGDWSIDVTIGNATSTIDETDPDFPTGAIQTEGTNPTTTLVTAGDTFAEIDGFFESGELSGRLYFDVNGNGTQDAGENGIADIDVQIEDALGDIQIVVTDVNGDWTIQLPIGNATSTIDESDPDFPIGAIQTEGTNPTTTTITNGDVFSETDGYFQFGTLTGRLYLDSNGNGTQDAGESGIPDVDVEIEDVFGISQIVVTDTNGDWSIDVAIGNATSTIDETDPDFPTGATQTEGTNPTTTLVTAGDTFAEVDGFFQSGELSGRLYFDLNGNGTQDAGENGIADVDVQIDDALGNTQIVVTDVNGDWSFQAPVGNVTTTIDESDPDFPIGAIQTEGTNPTTTLITNGDTFAEVDGYFESGELSGRLYFDTNGNGTQDNGENGIADVDVQIDDALGNTQNVVTDVNGDWTIQVPVGNVTSTIDETDPDFPTGALQTEGTNPTTTLITIGDAFNEIDGFFESGEISGRLYLDDNGNGNQDAGENGIPDVNVQIDDALGNSQILVTDINGDWSAQVPAGNLISTIDVLDPDFPIGATQTEGTNPTTTTIINGSAFAEVDGFFLPDPDETGTLTGHLYLDDNGNGTQDSGEVDLPDVDVIITDSQNNILTVATDVNGDWSVVVPTGNTVIDIDETDPDFPAGAIQTEGTDPTTTLVIPNVITFSENDGFFVPDPNDTGTLTGHLYLDDDGSGTQDSTEPDLPNVDIFITDSQNNVQVVTTDANGDWFVVVPTGNTESDIDEFDPDFPAGATQTEGTDPTLTLVIPDVTTFSENDGFFIPDNNDTGTLTGHLYLDDNGNANQDVGEPDLPDVDLIITDSQSNVQVVTTDANGDWSVVVPTGNTESDIDETDPDFPVGAIQTEGTDPTTTLVAPNVTTFSEDDGFFVPNPDDTGTLTGHLYLDDNGNATQDPGEPDLPDVDVVITDNFNNTLTVSTDANGDWSVVVPTGNTVSDIDETDPDFPVGAVQTEGTDPTTTLVVPDVTTFSENDGFFIPDPEETGTLTGHLYLDENGNGTQDPLEPNLPDIDIIITDSQGNIQIIPTDINGDWSVVVPTGNTESDIDETDPDFPIGAIQTEGTDPTITLAIPDATTFSENDGFFVEADQIADLSGRLYLDENNNGTQDPGEPGIPFVSVEIEDDTGLIQVVETDINGNWSAVVNPGDIISLIDITDPDFPQNAIQTEGTNPTLTALNAGEQFDEVDGFFAEKEVIVYNALSPNGDGRNDFLRIDGLEQFESNSIEIFNRNGVRVYETRDYGNDDNIFTGFSDGRITISKSQKLPSGTYFYILIYTDQDGRTTKKQGYLYIN